MAVNLPIRPFELITSNFMGMNRVGYPDTKELEG